MMERLCCRPRRSRSLALAVIFLSFILILYQLSFLRAIEEYSRTSALQSHNQRVRGGERERFVCLPSGMEIPMSHVNDDYCDCPDGSDEPETSACPNAYFICHLAKDRIPSSRVNDGICDCCDGSDEWNHLLPAFTQSIEVQKKSQVFQPPCPNVCSL